MTILEFRMGAIRDKNNMKAKHGHLCFKFGLPSIASSLLTFFLTSVQHNNPILENL